MRRDELVRPRAVRGWAPDPLLQAEPGTQEPLGSSMRVLARQVLRTITGVVDALKFVGDVDTLEAERQVVIEIVIRLAVDMARPVLAFLGVAVPRVRLPQVVVALVDRDPGTEYGRVVIESEVVGVRGQPRGRCQLST